jgi:hypothetical protein
MSTTRTCTRFWNVAMVSLCTLLLQNCQSNSVSAIAEEQPEVGSVSSIHQCISNESLAVCSLAPSSSSTSIVAHISPSRFSTILFNGRREELSACSLIPSSSSMGASPAARYNLPATAVLKASHMVPLSNTLGCVLSPIFTTSSGERVRFSQVDGQWRAVMQVGYGAVRTLPIVGTTDVSGFLSWLQGQDQWTSRARIHILKMPQKPYSPCVYLGGVGLLGGAPTSSGQGVSQVSRMASNIAFGAKEWAHYFGEVGEAPDLPRDIDTILSSTCPFWPEKEVGHTHLLVLIPATVDGAPFTLSLLEELIQRPKNYGHKTNCVSQSQTKVAFRKSAPGCSYWLLMTRDVLEGSRGRAYAAQSALVARYTSSDGRPYEVPGVLEAATSILMYHTRTRKRLFGDDPGTMTRCQEVEDGNHFVVGGFGSSGLFVGGYDYDRWSIGVSGCQKFCEERGSRTTSAHEQGFSTTPSFHSLNPPASSMASAVGSSPAGSCDLLAAAIPRASYTASLGDEHGRALFRDSSFLECSDAVLKGGSTDEEMSIDETEDSKPPAARPSLDFRGAPSTSLAMVGSGPEEGAEYLKALLFAAQQDFSRSKALEALEEVAKTSPDLFFQCLPTLRIVAQEGAKEARSFALRTLGAVEWAYYFGGVGAVPDLPKDTVSILDSQCPFWPDRKVGDTHLLVLMPATVSGVPFTLNLLGELIKHPKNDGHETKYRHYDKGVRLQIGASSPKAPYWLLMTRDVLPESRDLTYRAQIELVANHSNRTGLPYELPQTLEVATALLTYHVRGGERLYHSNPWTYTRCKEWIFYESRYYPAIVGGLEPSGLLIGHFDYGSDSRRGVAGCRRFI